MRPVLLSQIAEWCEARLLGEDMNITHVSTDTRALSKGSLFVALRGENFDAHDFIAALNFCDAGDRNDSKLWH